MLLEIIMSFIPPPSSCLGVEVSSESGGSVHSVDPASSSKQQQVSDSPIKRTRSADQLTSDTLV